MAVKSSPQLEVRTPSTFPRTTRDGARTRQIIEAGRMLKIVCHDHLVVGAEGVASFKALRLI